MTVLILTDNPFALVTARGLCASYGEIRIFQSPNGTLEGVPRLNVRTQTDAILKSSRLVLSIHCKQIFPPALVHGVRCVNVHPGYNPFNRGWYPQVFSIVNGLKAGVTIHEIDTELDHGPIIARREYGLKEWDTSASAYAKIMAIEHDLLCENYVAIRDHTYTPFPPEGEGNINLRRDFEALRKIDLAKVSSCGDFLNHLRALSHENHRNAYFLDSEGKKVFVRVILERE